MVVVLLWYQITYKMKLTAKFNANHLTFKIPGGTSRGVLKNKPTWYLHITNQFNETGIGECSIIPNLSIDDVDEIENKLSFVCDNINHIDIVNKAIENFPAIQFAVETALLDLHNGGKRILFPSRIFPE